MHRCVQRVGGFMWNGPVFQDIRVWGSRYAISFYAWTPYERVVATVFLHLTKTLVLRFEFCYFFFNSAMCPRASSARFLSLRGRARALLRNAGLLLRGKISIGTGAGRG